MSEHPIFKMRFSDIYPHYLNKAKKKGRSKEAVDRIILWLTGYEKSSFTDQIDKQVDVKTFFNEAPCLNPARKKITGVICGVRVEDIKDPLMQEIRYLDKLIDELTRGKTMEKIFRR